MSEPVSNDHKRHGHQYNFFKYIVLFHKGQP